MNSSAVLITGGAKRIGKAISIKLANLGYDIAVNYNRSHDDAVELKKEIIKLNVKCDIFKYDLSDENNLESLMTDVISVFPNLKIIINNASIFKRACIVDTDSYLFNKTFNINFRAPYFLSKIFTEKIGKGLIINIIDTKISKNNFLYSAYTLSKKVLAEFTLQAAKELGPSIRVNGIAPGLILPPDSKNDIYLEKMAKSVPMKKKGSLSDVTNAVEYIINNDYITGQIIYIDGGQHL